MDVVLKGVCVVLFIAGMFFVGMLWANHSTISGLTARIDELYAGLTLLQTKAKADEKLFRENSDVIKGKDDKYRAAIAYYERLLSKAAGSHNPGNAPENTEGMDSAPGQPTLTGCPVEVESRLLEDARVRAGMAEFFRTNKFPVEN